MTLLVKDLDIKDTISWVECLENWTLEDGKIGGGGLFLMRPKKFKKEYANSYVYSIHYYNDTKSISVMFGNKAKDYEGEENWIKPICVRLLNEIRIIKCVISQFMGVIKQIRKEN